MKKVRCAIYTRKSSEEGLEQDFNSLHAQREACAAYVLSQASEGWSLVGAEYDDGGISGGTLERPALRRLLADIEARRIDIVVVYKVDRLTRSLLDFARLVETMDKAGVSFVSVTQSFNTTTSMGRLTLNMLLSFAQFEREVTAERIRDKIAASKARGMWMGGMPPLGYEPDGRSLKVVEEHAALMRDIFAHYLALGSVRLVHEQLIAKGVTTPSRTLTSGRTIGGKPFMRSQLYRMLSSPVYVGEVRHRGQVYQGKHEGIIERGLWDAVQRQLAENRQGEKRKTRASSPSLLTGLVFDETGEPLVASHTCKGTRRYRYYVSRALQHDSAATGGAIKGSGADSRLIIGLTEPQGIRIPARELEAAVAQRITEALSDPMTLAADAGLPLEAARLPTLMRTCGELATAINAHKHATTRALVSRVEVSPQDLQIELSGVALGLRLGFGPDDASAVILTSKVRLSRSGLALRLVHSDGRPLVRNTVNAGLVALLQRARNWWDRLAEGNIEIATIAREEQVNDSWVSRVVRLNFLAPPIVQAILNGTQPVSVTAASLRSADIPDAWDRQLAYFGMVPAGQ
jgi:DNA invertase Pin-like site-specific DNA recombinase